MGRQFQARKEDFVCEQCGTAVSGGGYTNHCPQCLWSKHVDINPGDREEACGGMMKPEGIELTGGEYSILHRCTACGTTKKNKASAHDNFDTLLPLAGRN